MSSSNRGARVLQPSNATVVGRVSAERQRVQPAGSTPAPSWHPDELDVFDLSVSPSLDGAVHHVEAPAPFDLEAALEAARAEAFAAGLETGRAQGVAAERDHAATALAAAEQAIALARDGTERWMANAEENIVALAIGVARHVIDRDVARDDTLLRALVARAVAEFPVAQSLTVRINPADLALLAVTGRPADDTRAEMTWTPDARIARGGCVIEGRDRIIDGRVDTALERLYRRLTGNHA